MMKLLLSGFLVVVFLGCAEEKKEIFQLPGNAKMLLTGDSAKTWKLARRMNNDTRMNMGDCFLSYRLTVKGDGSLQDNNGQHVGCGETLKANWQFAETQDGAAYLRMQSSQLPTLMGIDEDFKLFKLLALSDSLMVLQYQHKQFSSKTTTITDIYVPEHTKVSDRNFHW